MRPFRLDAGQLWGAALVAAGVAEPADDAAVRSSFARIVELAGLGAMPAVAKADDPECRARDVLVEMLAGRFRFVADESRYPGIREERLEHPVFVVGVRGAGIEHLHRLLATHPSARAPRYWELRPCSPPPALATTDQRRRDAHARLERFGRFFPGGGEAVAACEWIWASDAYLGGYLRQPVEGRYGFHRRFLQHLQYGSPSRRWILGGPTHIRHLAALESEYPDASVVWLHRHPLVAAAQAGRELAEYAASKEGRPVGAEASRGDGRHELLSMARHDLPAALAARGTRRALHVRFTDLVADPARTLAAIHEWVRLEPVPLVQTPAVPAATVSNPGAVDGLDATDEAMVDAYCRQFGLTPG